MIEWVYGNVLVGAYADQHITRFTRDGLQVQLRSLGFGVLACWYVGFCEVILKVRKPKAKEKET